MSILQPYEIPTPSELHGMTDDMKKHMANKYMEPYRILRSAFLDLTSSYDAVINGKFPNEYDPVKWRKLIRIEREDNESLARMCPLQRLKTMHGRSKIWFEKWEGYRLSLEDRMKEMEEREESTRIVMGERSRGEGGGSGSDAGAAKALDKRVARVAGMNGGENMGRGG